MSQGKIIVDTAILDSTADKVESLADDYNSEYTALYNTVQELGAEAWMGEDNTAFTNQIEGFKDDFQRMEKLMREYANFIHKAATAYRETQDNLASSVKNLSQGS